MASDSVWLLWHVDDDDDAKLIGVFLTRKDARAAKERVKGKPGFSTEGNFETVKYELNRVNWPDGFIRTND